MGPQPVATLERAFEDGNDLAELLGSLRERGLVVRSLERLDPIASAGPQRSAPGSRVGGTGHSAPV